MADALLSPIPGEMTFAINRRLVDDVALVSDAEIGMAMRLLAERAKQLVEPAGAVALAAVVAGRVAGSGPILVVVSGGNPDLGRLPAQMDFRAG